MNTRTIVTVNQGKTIPNEYLELVRKKCPSTFGFAIQLPDGTLVCESHPNMPDIKDFEVLQAGVNDKKGRLMMVFSNFPGNFEEDDIQPWKLEIDDKPALLMCCEGDFPDFDADKAHSNEYNLFDEIVFPRLAKAYTDSGEDLDKFYDILADVTFSKTLNKQYANRGVFCLMPTKGEIISHGHNEIGGTYPWGTVSVNHGYPKATAPIEKKGALSWMKGSKSTIREAAPVTVVDKVTLPPETDTAIEAGMSRCYPPVGLQGKARNKWFRMFNAGSPMGKDGLPENHESSKCSILVKTPLLEYAKRPIKDAKGLVILNSELKSKGLIDVLGETVDDVDIPITKTAPKSGADIKEKRASSAADYLPIMSDKEKENAMGVMIPIVDRNNRSVPTPLELQKINSKFPAFSETVGIPDTDLLFITPKNAFDLDHKALVCAFIEVQQKWAQHVSLKDILTKVEPVKLAEKKDEPVISATKKSPLSWMKKSA